MNSPAMLRIAALLLIAFVSVSKAGPGHDHGPAQTAPAAGGPRRLADGSVFLPKPAQRQLGVRTTRLEPAPFARSVELAGKVSMDPNSGGNVQSAHPGRIMAGPKGLPVPGQAVRQGEVLAWVAPTLSPVERATQAAALAELNAAHVLAEKKLSRLQALADTVPRKDIEAAQSELQSLAARIDALGQGQGAREPLVAPVSGVIASSRVVAGQVVEARERVFEVVNPSRFQIEAQSYDTALAGNVREAFLAGRQPAPRLKFLGAARSLREQALPLHFSLVGDTPHTLALGESVRVVVQTQEVIKAIPVPLAALMKNPANQSIVWVKAAPEVFVPRVVTYLPLDGVQVAVVGGLESGDRVVTQGASLINQVR